MLKSFKIYTCTNGALGLHLSRAPWDPYPWVSSIQKDSTSYVAGLRIGDCLLELNGQDVLGLKISEIAALLKNHWLNESSNYVTVVMWRNKCNSSTEGTVEAAVDAAHDDDEEDEENNAHNINQQSLQKFATCLQHIAQLLECPVCLEVIKPPGWQCCNGHVLCNNCRSRSEKCPVCRVPLGPRGRCLLSDKLFTLLADSFPCDGVRSNKNSPKDRRKCSTDFHNQPKMAILQKQQQQQHHHDGEIKAKDFKKIQQNFILTTSSTRRRIKTNSSSTNKMEDGVKEENKHTAQHPSMEQTMNDTNFVVNINKGNNSLGNGKKSSLDYSDVATALRPTGVGSCKDVALAATFGNEELLGQTTTIYQCHCITCYKSDKVEIVNNVTTTTTSTATTLNKYILQVSATQQEQQQQQQQEGQACLVQHRQQKEKYQNYQCPTGKLCCLTKNVLPSAAQTTTSTFTTTTTTLTNNKLSTKQTTAESTKSSNAEGLQRQGLQDEECNFRKTLKNEWEVLAHLTEDHHLPVNQYYAEYGQPIAVHCHKQQKTITCLNLRGNDDNSKIDKFLLACIPIEMAGNPTNSNKVAIFIYHMNTLSTTSPISLDDDEVSNFETIIENPLTGIKWFGRAHALTTPWSQIYHKQHFLMHEILENDDGGVDAAAAAGGSGVSDAFVIVIKTKL